jgi:hypothetical protein
VPKNRLRKAAPKESVTGQPRKRAPESRLKGKHQASPKSQPQKSAPSLQARKLVRPSPRPAVSFKGPRARSDRRSDTSGKARRPARAPKESADKNVTRQPRKPTSKASPKRKNDRPPAPNTGFESKSHGSQWRAAPKASPELGAGKQGPTHGPESWPSRPALKALTAVQLASQPQAAKESGAGQAQPQTSAKPASPESQPRELAPSVKKESQPRNQQAWAENPA